MARFKRCALFVVLWLAVARCQADVSTATPPEVTTATPPEVTTATPPEVTTATPPEVTTATPPEVTTATPPEVTTATPPEVTTATLPEVTTATPPEVTTATPPEVTTATPPEVTTATPPEVTTATPPEVTTATPPEVTTATPPEVTTATPPEVTTATPPEVTTATLPEVTTATPPEVTTATPPEVTTATPPEVTTATPPEVTTATPPEVTTATLPEVTTATPPEVTTATPPEVTTATPPEVTTATPPEVTTATPPEVTTATPDVTTTYDPCNRNPCGTGSTCQKLFDTFTCLCLVGMNYYETEKRCADAKVFPGQLELMLPWNQTLADKTSQDFQTQSTRIITGLRKIFTEKDLGYLKSTVVEFKKQGPQRATDTTTATVENLFQFGSNATEDTVNATMDMHLHLLNATSFKPTLLCDRFPCDGKSSNCTRKDHGIFSCPCLPGYVTSEFSNRACFACPSGEWAVLNSTCEKCDFGRSGWNCEESWKLALVIMGSIFGGLLLLIAIVVGVLSRRPSRKSSKKTSGADEDAATYYSHSLAKAPLINPKGPMPVSASNGFPKIPRATPTRDPPGGGHMEMTPSNGRLNTGPWAGHAANQDPYEQNQATINPYVQNRDPYEQNRATTNPYVQNRDPYEQNRATTNPYGRNQAYNNKKQGYTNSNYMHDDERSY